MTRKILLGILAVLALVGGVGGSLYHRAGTSIRTHRAEIAALLDDLPLRQASRPALAIPGEPGSVWDVLGPAFESLRGLEEMQTTPGSISEAMEANFNLHGTPGPTPRLLEEGRAALDACRRSMRRRALDWTGPMDPILPYKAARATRALSSMGIQCWQQERDADALDWLLTALSVAYDAARLGQHRSWDVVLVTEFWVHEDARYVLSEQSLTATQLTEIERRFDQVRAQRPPLALALQIKGALARKAFLEELEDPSDHTAVPDWKDLYSWRLYTARMLTGLRSGFEDAGRLTWTSATDDADQRNRLILGRRAEVAERLVVDTMGELRSLIRLESIRVALACARFLAAEGRLPLKVEETGYVPLLGALLVTIEGDAVWVLSDGSPVEGRDWPLRRR